MMTNHNLKPAIKERPILFSTPMVKAILDGRKTQTRRVIKPVGKDDGFVLLDHGKGWWPHRSDDGERSFHTIKENGEFYDCETPHSCPNGKPGDRLWVRETFSQTENDALIYKADNLLIPKAGIFFSRKAELKEIPTKWRPSIFMPRKFSRINLEITNICVERLQDISEEDAIAEGVIGVTCNRIGPNFGKQTGQINGYRSLWESINGKDSWDLNPWVWKIEFKRV